MAEREPEHRLELMYIYVCKRCSTMKATPVDQRQFSPTLEMTCHACSGDTHNTRKFEELEIWAGKLRVKPEREGTPEDIQKGYNSNGS